MAEEVLGEYCDNARNRILDVLENGKVEDDQYAMHAVMMLNVIKQFRNNAQSFIDQGKMAERQLEKYGEDY